MSDRDRLIELIRQARKLTKNANCDLEREGIFADYLLANGVIVPPCKVGDIVYKLYDIETVHSQILELEVLMIEIGANRKVCLKTTKKYRYNFDKATFEDFGKTVFLTKEEAEKALAERSGNNA